MFIIVSLVAEIFRKFFVAIIMEVSDSRFAVINEYRSYYIDVKNVIVFAVFRMKEYYDARYLSKFFDINDLINLKFPKNYQILIIKSKKIGSQFIDSFRVIEYIERLVYRLDFFDNMRIHDIIFIVYLEFVINFDDDFYKRRRFSSSIVIIDGKNEY